MEKMQISFTQQQFEQLRIESEKLGSSIASIVRLAINNYFVGKEANHASE